ncbi:hypothetical protein BDW74DRAFT_55395 [Aspergillus multicolor]|uniref:uncharacterized protein n=1 Tax=Aspergillus multicolor TaxID=41759 RepID=UPI003CCE15F9
MVKGRREGKTKRRLLYLVTGPILAVSLLLTILIPMDTGTKSIPLDAGLETSGAVGVRSRGAVVGHVDFNSYWSFIDTEIALGIVAAVILVAVCTLRCSLNTCSHRQTSRTIMRFVGLRRAD